MGRTIQSPGVEINEIDLSLRPNLAIGTTVLAAGYADKGPADEVIQVTSLSEFEQIYGLPTTPAERYFYHSVKPLFNSQANVQTYRLPYGSEAGEGFGNDYGALAYPVSAVALSGDGGASDNVNVIKYGKFAPSSEHDGIVYIVGKPTHYQLSEKDYNNILKQESFEWSNDTKKDISTISDIQNAGIVVLNKGQTTINNKFEGFYFGMIDNSNINDATDFDGIRNVQSIALSAQSSTDYIKLPTARLGFTLSGANDAENSVFGQESDSISEVMENLSNFDLNTDVFDDTLSIGLFKLRQSVFASDVIKLDFVLSESYVGSFDTHRQIQSQNGGSPQSFFIGSKEDQSPNISVLINENLSRKNGETALDINGKPKNKIRMSSNATRITNSTIQALSGYYIPASLKGNINTASVTSVMKSLTGIEQEVGASNDLFAVGSYSGTNNQSDQKDLGSTPKKLDRLFDTVENPDIYNIDITIEAGLGTINAGRVAQGNSKYYDDIVDYSTNIKPFYKSDPTKITDTSYRDNWKTIYNKFNDFAEKRRKDHIFIADLPRPIFVQGPNYKTLNDTSKNFSLHINAPLKAFTTILNSSYATTYACWSKVYDKVLDDQTWVPFSGTAAELMANTDSNFQPWFAPAGFTRGRVGSVNDIVLYPKQKQRDQLYKNSINPVAFFPGDGFTVFGQKTLQAAPTAFDRINVRRLFLNLEKSTRATMKYFVFEPNTLLTRTRVINTLTPIFENAKNTEGLYDYLIVCDERNNTPDVIDQNELIVDIYIKPVRAAEFILVNFYATRTGADFNEIVG